MKKLAVLFAALVLASCAHRTTSSGMSSSNTESGSASSGAAVSGATMSGDAASGQFSPALQLDPSQSLGGGTFGLGIGG